MMRRGPIVPIGCADRMEFIKATACELGETFLNGNRSDLLAGLEELPPKVAYAVLATLIAQGDDDLKYAVARFLREVA